MKMKQKNSATENMHTPAQEQRKRKLFVSKNEPELKKRRETTHESPLHHKMRPCNVPSQINEMFKHARKYPYKLDFCCGENETGGQMWRRIILVEFVELERWQVVVDPADLVGCCWSVDGDDHHVHGPHHHDLCIHRGAHHLVHLYLHL